MKKEQLKTGSFNLDEELDLEPSDLDFDFGGEDLDNKREAASPVKDGIKSAVSSHLSMDSNIKRYIGKALPKEYADVFDTYTSVRDTATDALDDVKKITKKPVNDFAKLINEKVSNKHKRSKKALEWLIEQTGNDYQFERHDQRKEDENNINIAIGELQNSFAETFAHQAKAEEERRAEDKDRKNLELATQTITDARQTKLLNTIAKGTDILAKTEMGFNLAEKKKSLELRYRIAFGIRDLVTGQKELTELTKAYLKNIQHNTSLPDAQKLMMSERFFNTTKNKFINKTLGAFEKGGFAANAAANFKAKINQTAGDVRTGLELAHSGVDALTQDQMDFDDLSPEDQARKKRAKIATDLVLEFLGPKAVAKMSEAARKRSPGLEKMIQRGASKIGYYSENADSLAKDYAYGGDATESTFKKLSRSLTEMMLSSRDTDNKLNMASGDSLFEPGANGSQATSRALVEVIPGLLSRILQEQQIQRTGNVKQGLAHFDYKTGVFRYASDMKSTIEKSIVKNSSADSILEEVVKTLEKSGGNLDKKDQSHLKKFLIKTRKSGGTITPDRLMNPEFYKTIGVTGVGDRLSGAFKTHFESTNGKLAQSDSNLKKQYDLFRQINQAVTYSSDPRAVIQQGVSEGHVEILRELGWIKADGTINLDKAYTFGIGDDETSPDTSVWRPAQAGSSKQMSHNRRGKNKAKNNAHAVSFTPSPVPPPVAPIIQQPTAPVAPPVQPVSQPQDTGPNLTSSLLESLIKGQGKQTEWLEKIEHNTAQPIVMGGDGNGRPGTNGAAGTDRRGFFDRSLRNHVSSVGQAGKGLWEWWKAPSPMIDKAKDMLASSWLAGARKFKNFKDGLPDLADLYVYGSDAARITKAMFESQTLVDANGKIIASIKDLAESVGDIKDQTGNVILTQGEKLSSYLKSDGIVFAKTWYNRIKAAATEGLSLGNKLRKKAANALSMGFNTASGVGKAALKIGLEFIQPATDVYVRGETNPREPRLTGFLMRRDGYFDQASGKPIQRPTDISGPVIDASGQVKLTAEDLQKGIEDVNGKPFKTIMQMAVDRIKLNATNAKKAIGKVLTAGKNTANYALKTLKSAKNTVGKFFNYGMSAFNGSSNPSTSSGDLNQANESSSKTIELLTQIRDILSERLPGKKSNQGGVTGVSSFMDTQEQSTGAQSVAEPQTNTVGGRPIDILGMAGSAATSVASTALSGVNKVANKFKNKRGRLGKAASWLSSVTGRKTPEASGTQPDASPPVASAASQEAKKSKIQALKDKASSIKTKIKAIGTPSLTDLDGDGVRENSVMDKLRNKVNKNDASKARGGTREVQQFDTQNAVDFVMDKLSAAKGLVGSLMSGAADLFNMGGGDQGNGRGRGRGRRGGRGGARGAAGARGAQGAASSGASRLAARGAGIRSAAGTAARSGLAGAKWIATKALPFIAMRAIPAVVGAIGAVLGSPVIVGAAAVAGIGGLAWWGYKSLYKGSDTPTAKDSTALTSTRMAEYGFGLNDTAHYPKLIGLEKLLEPAIKKSDKGIELDKSKIPAQEVLSIFSIKEDEETRIQALLTWIECRFKPTYLKWQTMANNLNKPLNKLEQESNAVKLKILESTESSETGWDEIANPFGTGGDLTTDAKQVKDIIKAAKLLLKVEAKNDKATNKQIAEDVVKTGAVGLAAKSIIKNADGSTITPSGKPSGQKSIADKLNDAKIDKALMLANFSTGGLESLPDQKLDALTSVKLRAYGITEPTTDAVLAINALEKACSPFITVDKKGAGNSQIDTTKMFDIAGKYFGIAKSNHMAYLSWVEWFVKRFIPVFTTLRSNLQFHTGIADVELALKSINAIQKAAVAHQLVAVSDIWRASLSAWPDKPALADAKACDIFVKYLDEAARKVTLQEIQPPKAPSPSESKAKGYVEQRYDGPPTINQKQSTNPYIQNAMYKPPPPPDAETEPKSGGGSSLSQGAAKPSSAGVGSIPLAAGSLAGGNSGDQFINLRKGAKLDGMNPELLKLFKGMAEEFGTLTGKQIPVNSAARDFDQQMALHKANPSKAAKPGSSLHEKGLALDIDTATADELERMGLMKKYGFTRPIGGETWHIEPAGIQSSIGQAKNDPSFASQAILQSPGLGGGGAGLTKTAFAFGKRSTEIAMASAKASGNEVKAASDQQGSIVAGSSGGSSSSLPSSPISGGAGGGAPTTGYAASVQNVKDNQAPSAITQGSGAGTGAYAGMPEPGDKQANMALVKEAAKAVGVDPGVALTTTALESGFKSNAVAGTSTAKGLNQFTSGTWSDMMKKHAKDFGIPPDASPNDAKANALLGAQFLKTNLQTAQKRGMPADIVQSYLMHFLGAGGANTFNKLSDNDVVATAMPSAASANKPTFYDKNGKARTKAEMLSFITNKINKTAKDFSIDLGSAAPSAGYSAAPQMASAEPVPPSGTSAATTVSPKAVQASNGDFSQAYQPSKQSLVQAVTRDASQGPQTQSFDKLAEVINSSHNVQVQQLTALNGILKAVNLMAEKLSGQTGQSQTQPQSKEPPPERMAPGSNIRSIAEPLINA